ncbi:MAG: endonuclease/exonuclease/phosphatase family protein [Planctomycetota bacterium]
MRSFSLAMGVCVLLVGSASATLTGTFLDRLEATDVRVGVYNIGGFIDDDSGFTVSGSGSNRITTFIPQNARIMQAVDADVWAFQEIDNLSSSQIADALNRAVPLGNGDAWVAHRNAGQVIASKFPILDVVTDVPGDPREPAVATIDLPDELTDDDLHVLNLHLKARSGSSNEARRLASVDSLIDYLADTRDPDSPDALPAGTPTVVLGDYNTASGVAPVINLAFGRYTDSDRYGPDAPPDWDGTGLEIVDARHNVTGNVSYTFRSGSFTSRLDWIAHTDSVMDLAQAFVLNTVDMSAADLAATGLERNDVLFDASANRWDHLPLIADYRFAAAVVLVAGDFDGSGSVEQGDLNLVLNNWGLDTADETPDGWVNTADLSGVIDQAELNLVLNNWGNANATPDFSGFDVPEPAAASGLLLGVFVVTVRRRHPN